jgi:hypothetical protein
MLHAQRERVEFDPPRGGTLGWLELIVKAVVERVEGEGKGSGESTPEHRAHDWDGFTELEMGGWGSERRGEEERGGGQTVRG